MFVADDSLYPREANLLQMIELPGSKHVDFTLGLDGLPAYKINASTDLRSPSVEFFPNNELYQNFSIIFTVRPDTDQNGMLFSIMNPEQTIVSFGVGVSRVQPTGSVNISLYYVDYNHVTEMTHTTPAASFSVPAFTGQWQKFTLRLEGDQLELFFGCAPDGRKMSSTFSRDEQPLPIANGSTLFLGQAGALDMHFQVGGVYQYASNAHAQYKATLNITTKLQRPPTTSAVYVIVHFVVQGGLQDVTIISDASKAENYCYDVYEVSNNHVSHTVRNTDRSDSVS